MRATWLSVLGEVAKGVRWRALLKSVVEARTTTLPLTAG